MSLSSLCFHAPVWLASWFWVKTHLINSTKTKEIVSTQSSYHNILTGVLLSLIVLAYYAQKIFYFCNRITRWCNMFECIWKYNSSEIYSFFSSNTSSSTGTKQDICFNELFVPKMETSLHYFKGAQDVNTPHISFSYLNIVKAALANKNNCPTALGYAKPKLSFNCEFCKDKFMEHIGLMRHLEHLHKLEPSYICRKCMKSCPINQLAGNRWKHSCPDPRKKSQSPIASRVKNWSSMKTSYWNGNIYIF